MKGRGIGIDFGTTNSALAIADSSADAHLARYSDGDRDFSTFRSILYFDGEGRQLGGRAEAVAGPRAIRRYLEAEQRGRLVQSIKTFLTSRTFTETQIFLHTYTIQDLIAEILRQLLHEAADATGAIDGPVVLGRPVRFAGAESPDDDAFAESRLREAAAKAGLNDVVFELEPIAAAYGYERRLDHDELVLIGDFGGGTSDFTLARLGPGARDGERVLGNDGVGIAGDTFDSRIVRHLVAPRLGRGSTYHSLGGNHEIPAWIYRNLERWHYVSFLRSKRTLDMLRDMRVQAEHPERIEALIHLIEEDLGFAMYRAVDQAKCKLSTASHAMLEFTSEPVDVEETLDRGDFEDWIHPDVREIAACVDGLLAACAVDAKDVDSVFLTGGSSLVPVVRRYFERRFGADRLRGGEELTTVATGLALRAREL